MTRRLVLCVLLGLGCLGPAAAADRPNIVLVLVDDLRWDALGCAGHPFVKTPHIDRLAKDGALFKNCFVSIPLCSPSRASFLTGQYAHTHGVRNNRDNAALSHKLVTFPKLLHDAGYATAYMGKWHMGTDDSPRPGFDRWVSFRGQGVFEKPPLNIDGKPVQSDGYMTDELNRYAVEFIRKSHGRPFCLYLAHKAVHGPFTPAARHRSLYTDDTPKTPPSVTDDRSGKPAITANVGNVKPKKVAPKKKKAAATPAGGTMKNQLRCLAAIDEGIGLLFKALEETNQLDNTIFVFTSDNGYFWGEHGLGDKRWAYEESIRIPLIVRYPKLVKPGTAPDALVMNIDLAPTFLELGGGKPTKDMQGRSLLPLLRGEAGGRRTALLTEYFQEQGFERVPTWHAVRTERWKYVRYAGHPEWDELYDLSADAYEMKNLIAVPAHKATLEKLKAELVELLRQTGGA